LFNGLNEKKGFFPLFLVEIIPKELIHFSRHLRAPGIATFPSTVSIAPNSGSFYASFSELFRIVEFGKQFVSQGLKTSQFPNRVVIFPRINHLQNGLILEKFDCLLVFIKGSQTESGTNT